MTDEEYVAMVTAEAGQREPTTGYDSSIADHDYFVIPSVTDVDKMREEAYRRQQGDYYASTESSVIHHHRFDEDCDQDPTKHEVWLRLEKKDD